MDMGANHYGQIGNGTAGVNDPVPAPIQVAGLSNVVQVSAGSHHNIVLKEDGTVWVWDLNMYGQLGIGSTEDKYRPVQLKTDLKV